MEQFAFEWALQQLRMGKRVCRSGWNGKGMYIVYQRAYPEGIPINENTAQATGLPVGQVCKFKPYLMIRTADEAPTFVPWVASQSDILGLDWIYA